LKNCCILLTKKVHKIYNFDKIFPVPAEIQFQSSLQNPSNPDVLGITLYPDNNTLTIIAGSNYAEATESGNLQAAFASFRKVLVKDPNAVLYVFSSIDDGDEDITAGVAGNSSFLYDMTEAGDGVYVIRLIDLPDYSSGASYDLTDCVYYGSKMYKSLVSPNAGNQPDISADEWEEVTDVTLINGKYNVFATVCRTVDLEQARVQFIYDALAGATYPLHTLERDFNFLKALDFDLNMRAIDAQSEAGEWDRVRYMIANAKEKAAA
jgi:hypothetical protein